MEAQRRGGYEPRGCYKEAVLDREAKPESYHVTTHIVWMPKKCVLINNIHQGRMGYQFVRSSVVPAK
jgi:hypothetical protein